MTMMQGIFTHPDTDAGSEVAVAVDKDGHIILGGSPMKVDSSGLVATGIVDSVLMLDLGHDWGYSRVIGSKNGLASAGEILKIEYSDDAMLWRVCPSPFSNNIAWTNQSSNNVYIQGIPLGRYIRLVYTNGATNQTAMTLLLSAARI